MHIRKRAVELPDPVSVVFPSGQEWYVGASDIFMICLGLSFAIKACEEVIKKHPKKAGNLDIYKESWERLLQKNALWLSMLDKLNE